MSERVQSIGESGDLCGQALSIVVDASMGMRPSLWSRATPISLGQGRAFTEDGVESLTSLDIKRDKANPLDPHAAEYRATKTVSVPIVGTREAHDKTVEHFTVKDGTGFDLSAAILGGWAEPGFEFGDLPRLIHQVGYVVTASSCDVTQVVALSLRRQSSDYQEEQRNVAIRVVERQAVSGEARDGRHAAGPPEPSLLSIMSELVEAPMKRTFDLLDQTKALVVGGAPEATTTPLQSADLIDLRALLGVELGLVLA